MANLGFLALGFVDCGLYFLVCGENKGRGDLARGGRAERADV